MAVDIRPKQKKAKAKKNRSLDIGSIAISMRDAYYHFPNLAKPEDIALLAINYAVKMHEIEPGGWDYLRITDSYKAGYALGSQQCARMESKEHAKILSNFYKLKAEEGDMGRYLIFGSFKEEIEDFVVLREIKDIDDFNSKMEKGELVWQSN
jgi:hypothetical protein